MTPSGAMTARTNELRLTLRLSGKSTLDEELGLFGASVALRSDTSVNGRIRQAQREDFCLRRVLVAWERVGELKRPVTISAPREGGPDFTLSWDKDTRLGIEVTQSGSEEDQREMARSELSEGDEIEFISSPGADGIAPRREAAKIADEIERVVRLKLTKKSYQRPVQLVVYENSETGFVAEKSEVIKLIRSRDELCRDCAVQFDGLHLIYGQMVYLDLFGRCQQVDLSVAYEIDFDGWLRAQAQLLRRHEGRALDFEYLAEEIEDLAKRDEREVKSQVRRLLVHLLKWQFQPSKRSKSWRLSIQDARDQLADIKDDSSSLFGVFYNPDAEMNPLAAIYERARRRAADETGIDLKEFPIVCPYKFDQLLDSNFLPDSVGQAERSP